MNSKKELNDWYIDNFRTALYIACGYAECSANDLRNEPDGSYKDIFMNVSRVLSAKKGIEIFSRTDNKTQRYDSRRS